MIDTILSWAYDMVCVLTKAAFFLRQVIHAQTRVLLKKCGPFTMLKGSLYPRGNDDVLRRCVGDLDIIVVIEQAHCGSGSGHFNHESPTCKIL